MIGVPLELADDFGIPHDAIDGLVPEASALTNPTRAFFDTATGVGDSVSALDAYFLEKIVIELMGALLLSSRGVGHAMRAGEASLHDKALALMTARRADQELSPAKIAQDLNVSLRHLQRDFSRNGASVADTLRRLRAEHAVQLLGDPQYDVLSIPEIAHYSGFSSPQLLRRALATFGWGSPADVRRGRV
ncbi:hypothetical protein GCM10008096_22780 [Zhihengliuella salsuginis]|uniref:HTH araC/xylS-type domain-containing protein n=1 Tax=Zhihengliuella salsuginis TaxID=578222 RepID=A0ABQ3GJ00_9MICC|nr:hypothetical protein GCM10008096_22780 [Zhihengliuella salsuginis]